MLKILKPKMINEVIYKIFIKTLPTISGYPDYDPFNEMIQALYANVATLLTTLSSWKHGHVVLIMKDTM